MGPRLIRRREFFVERARIDPAEVEDVVLGCGLPEGATGHNIARNAALEAGFGEAVPGATINRYCGSGLTAASIVANSIAAGEASIAIALGGLVAEELCLGESGTGPAGDLAHATSLAAQMVGSFGMAGSLISFDAVAEGAISRTNLVAKVLGDPEGKQRVEDILEAQRVRVRAALEENRDMHAALRDALIDRDELVGAEILEVIEKALANRD